MKKQESLEISPKSTKNQILAAYNEVLEKLNEKQVEIPLEGTVKLTTNSQVYS